MPNYPTSSLKGHLEQLGSHDPGHSSSSGTLHVSLENLLTPCILLGVGVGNTLGTAVPCGLSLHTTRTCVNSTFIKPTLNYPNFKSVPSIFSWDFDRYSLIEAIY